MRVGALTMVYNEPVWARVWVRHYAREIGAAHCVVLDHGSDDGSTAGLGVRVERIERDVLDEEARAAVVSDRVAAMLREYDAVIHTDADELLVADPARWADLRSCAADMGEVVTAIGLDLHHLPDEEPALAAGRAVGEQRRFVRFSAAMCKPALVRRAVRWSPGFHGCDAERAWGGVYLVHLRYADLDAGLRRLARTRGLRFARADTNLHQRVADSEFEALLRAVAALPREAGALEVVTAPWMARMAAGWAREDGQLSLAGDVLWGLDGAMRAHLV